MIRFDEVLASDDFAPEEFDALGVAQEAGAAGALSRIRQVETDQRWLARYLLVQRRVNP
ncbi:MAG: hypothetical protein JF587_18225 [Catenulisporales bacterium]|nr:hypothetical protein [Catenulisporales bacterium]